MSERNITKFENPFLYDRRQGESLQQQYRRLAKLADQRMVRLEKLSTKDGFTNVLKFSYARASKDIEHWSGKLDKPRFNRNMPDNAKQLEAKIRDMQTFLQAPTSTKAGIESVYKARADTINEKYGNNFTWQDLSTFFDSSGYERADKTYGSKTVLKAIATIQKNSSEILKQIEQHRKKVLYVEDVPEKVQSTINQLLSDKGINTKKLLKYNQ